MITGPAYDAFWQAFSIADFAGEDGVIELYHKAMQEWSDDYEYLTDLVMVLNHKIWQHYESRNEKLARVYDNLWKRTEDYAWTNLTEEELHYYFRMTD